MDFYCFFRILSCFENEMKFDYTYDSVIIMIEIQSAGFPDMPNQRLFLP